MAQGKRRTNGNPYTRELYSFGGGRRTKSWPIFYNRKRERGKIRAKGLDHQKRDPTILGCEAENTEGADTHRGGKDRKVT